MIISSNSPSRGSGMPHQVDDAIVHAHVRYRAVPRTNRTSRFLPPEPINQRLLASRGADIVMQSSTEQQKFVGKIWERTQHLKTLRKSHRINGPHILVRAHNPKVVSLNLPPATNLGFTGPAGVQIASQKLPIPAWPS